MTSAEEVTAAITNLTSLEFNVTGFHIVPGANGDESSLVVIFNPRSSATTVALPEGEWNICVNGERAGTDVLGTAQGEVTVDPISAMVLVQGGAVRTEEAVSANYTVPVVGAVLAVAAAFVILKKRKK